MVVPVLLSWDCVLGSNPVSMSLEPSDTTSRIATVGVDAVDLSRYQDIKTNSGDILIYDKYGGERWIESSLWVDPIIFR